MDPSVRSWTPFEIETKLTKARFVLSKLRQIMALGIASLIGLTLIGCDASKHKMVETQPGKQTICRLCYEEIVNVPPNPRYAPMGVIRRHRCEECKSETSIYMENGVKKIRCSKCAPEGLDCDKCLPPD